MRRLLHLAIGALALAAALGLASAAAADDDDRRKGRQRVFYAGVDGFQEVPSSI